MAFDRLLRLLDPLIHQLIDPPKPCRCLADVARAFLHSVLRSHFFAGGDWLLPQPLPVDDGQVEVNSQQALIATSHRMVQNGALVFTYYFNTTSLLPVPWLMIHAWHDHENRNLNTICHTVIRLSFISVICFRGIGLGWLVRVYGCYSRMHDDSVR